MRRIRYIDIARAFAIILIVFGHAISHSDHVGNLYKFIYSFHVALFFFISGILTINIESNFGEYLKKKFIRIMIPYFIWATLFLIPFILFTDGNEIFNLNSNNGLNVMLLKIIYGNGNNDALNQNTPLWFLPTLFCMSIINYFIIKINEKINNRISNKNVDIIIYILLVVIGFMSTKIKFYLPWGINNAIAFENIFYLGYIFSKYDIMKYLKQNRYIPFIFLLIGIISCYLNTTIVSIAEFRYGMYLLAVLSGTLISIFILWLAYCINESILIEKIGYDSMGILIFHKIIIVVFQTKLRNNYPVINK